MRPRALLVLLGMLLVLSLARQICDLVGRLWLCVLFDLLQLLVCIIGVFAECQSRRPLLLSFCLGCLLLILYNIFIIIWYAGVLGDVSVPLLSAGAPYSFSFWTRYTPFCGSHFDLERGMWKQDCAVSSAYTEMVVAGVHAVLLLVASLLSLYVLCWRKKSSPPAGVLFKPPSANLAVYTNCSFEGAEYTDIKKGDRKSADDHSSQPRKSTRRFEKREERLSPRETRTTSLISFDPKSPIPLQVHERVDSEEELEDFVVRGCGSGSGRGSGSRRWTPPASPGFVLSREIRPPKQSSFQLRSENGSLVGHYHSVEELQLVDHLPSIKGLPLLV